MHAAESEMQRPSSAVCHRARANYYDGIAHSQYSRGGRQSRYTAPQKYKSPAYYHCRPIHLSDPSFIMFLSLVLLSCLSASSVKASLSVVTVAQIINAASNRSPARPGFFSREGWLVCNATTGAVTVSGDTTPVDIASDVIAANVELGTNIVEATVNIQNEGELFTIKTTLGAITHTFFAAQPIADGAPLSSFVQGAKNSIRQENNTIWQFNIKIHDVQQDTAGKVYALWTVGIPALIISREELTALDIYFWSDRHPAPYRQLLPHRGPRQRRSYVYCVRRDLSDSEMDHLWHHSNCGAERCANREGV
ncbi:hypothetical protein B0H15DRAFT_30873 [Mycena belliarum]|uniref:Uncharacterized protein n=1 Tax=Mycena belliarum TaxID=1033014 RepID=A0AAD6XW17_9AGAR|nr:hypothetical protein B0H15DRAFT_30873 [Mycena belliae]